MGRRLKVVPDKQCDAMSILCECHRRIEESLEVLAVLLELPPERPLSPSHIHAMKHVMDCFSKDMDCHHVDEEQTLFPRVASSDRPEMVHARSILARLIEEHKQADMQHEQANVLMGKWVANRVLNADERAELVGLHSALQEMYKRHIHEEATCVFKLASELLGQQELVVMGEEMVRRRG